jgi:DivIVA domain-containing protein
MPLSPKDVEQRTFTASFRGYAEEEVDHFLEEVIASIEEYQQMVRERDARIAELEAGLVMAPVVPSKPAPEPEPEPEPEPTPEPAGAPTDESAVSRVLIVAQRTADQLVDDANRDAERILEEARRRADELDEADAEHRQTLMDGYRRLRSELVALRNRMGDSFSNAETTFRSLETEIDEFLARDVPAREANPSAIDEVLEDAEDHGDASDRRPWERG